MITTKAKFDILYIILFEVLSDQAASLFSIWLDPFPLLPDDALLLWLHEGIVIGTLNVVGLLLTLGAYPVVCGIRNIAELACMILDNGAVGLGIDILSVVGRGQGQEDPQQQKTQQCRCKEKEREKEREFKLSTVVSCVPIPSFLTLLHFVD